MNQPIMLVDPNGHAPCKPGYRCVTPIADKRDLTTWLTAAAVDISKSSDMQSVREAKALGQGGTAWALFISVVKDGAKYDVKDKMLEQFRDDPIKIGNSWYEYSTAGNILYGFYGKADGFTEFELHAGAGAAQLADYRRDHKNGKGNLSTLFDTEDDYAAVGFGMYLYDDYYKEDKNLTQADLLDAFDTYKDRRKMALRDKPKDFQPRYFDYPVNRFYHTEMDAE